MEHQIDSRSLLSLDWSEATPTEVLALLDRGADLTVQNQGGETPLHLAAKANERPAVVRLLLDYGADLTAQSRSRQTPLHLAAKANEPSVVALLLDRGADTRLRDKVGNIPVAYAAENEKLKDTDVYRRLHDASF